MTLAVLFWVLMIVWLVFGWYLEYTPGQPYPLPRAAHGFLVFVLLALLGWGTFGAPLR